MRRHIFTSILIAGLWGGALLGPAWAAVEDDVERETCSAEDYRTLRADLESTDVEMTPEASLALMEDYLLRCPDRIETPSIARLAGRAALDAGDADRALALYQIALYQGAPFDRDSRINYMSVLLETGAEARAWALRDQEVAHWLGELDQRGVANVTTQRLRDGWVHHVVLRATDPDFGQSELWVAVPHAAGWPAAIVRASDPKRVALRRLVQGSGAEAYEHLDLVRCYGRATLVQSDTGLAATDVDAIALDAVKTYLRRPDLHRLRDNAAPVSSCLDTHRLFVSPDPRYALPIVGVQRY